EELDDRIREMIESPSPVIFDCRVLQEENCFPMIPSGAAHYEMLLGPADKAQRPISEEGIVLVCAAHQASSQIPCGLLAQVLHHAIRRTLYKTGKMPIERLTKAKMIDKEPS